MKKFFPLAIIVIAIVASWQVLPSWLLLVFLSLFLHAITSHIDAFLVGESEKTKHVTIGALIVFSAFAGLFGVFVSSIMSTGFFAIPTLDKLLLIGTGIIELVAVL